MSSRGLLLALISLLLIGGNMVAADEKTDPQSVPRWTKRIFMVAGRPDLQWPVTEVSERSHYSIGAPIQLSPTQAALVCGIKQVGIAVIDLSAGSDLIPFDSLDRLSEKNAIPLVRNHRDTHPRNGAPLVMVKAHVACGFAPLGAKLRDGAPHPGQGTGFGIMVALGYPPDHSDLWAPARKDIHDIVQVQQYRYDGRTFMVTKDSILDPNRVISGWHVDNVSLDNPLPDGKDFLVGLVGRDGVKYKKPGCMVSRWQFADGEWRPASVVYVEGSEGSFEPSMVRDRDGSLLLSVRRGDEFNVWRSADGGATWRQMFRIEKARASTPVTIHRTLGGAPFLCANPYVGPCKNGLGQEVGIGRWRETTAFWPLKDDRTGVEPPSFQFDFGRPRFGPSPNGSALWADHPVSGIVRLADGKLHCLLCLRVWCRDEVSNEVLATPMSGTWVKEVQGLNDGPEIPVWSF
jgi:hypothetical protein